MQRFIHIPAYSTNAEFEQRSLRQQFGDGYEQRAIDGVNATRQIWSLSFRNVTKAKADQIVAFLANVGSVTAFIWTPPPPHNTALSWTAVHPYRDTYDAYDNRTIEVQFRQDHNPAQRAETPVLVVGSTTITITTATASATMHWTDDGTIPTEEIGTLYTAPITKQAGKTYRAVAMRNDILPSEIGTATT